MKEYLTELEIEKIEAFCKDEVLFEAVRKVILQSIYTHGTVKLGYKPNPLYNGAFSLASLSMTNPIPDEIVGQHLKAMWAGVNAMENAFKDLESLKNGKVVELEDLNDAI